MGTLLRTLIRWILLMWLALLVLAILFIGVVVALLSTLWSLLRGRKPALFTTFARFREASQQVRKGMWKGPAAAQPRNSGDIVDVQVKELLASAIDNRDQPPKP